MRSHDEFSSRTIGVIAGAAIGAGLALLFAPRAGAETRRQLHDYSRRRMDRMNSAGARLRAQGQDLVSRGRRAASRLSERGRDLAGRGRDYAERGRELADRAAGHLQAVADEMRTSQSAAAEAPGRE